MDFKSQASLLFNFLTETKELWEDEVLDSYPQSIEKFNPEWIELLWNLPITDWYKMDAKLEVLALKNTSLDSFIQKIKNLTEVNENPVDSKNQHLVLEDWAFRDVKFKKKHEIENLAPLIKSLQSKHQFNKVIDIGGGVGHLSRIISHYYGIETFCVDCNLDFQNIGQKRISKFRKLPDAKNVNFVHLNFGDDDIKNQEIEDTFLKMVLDKNSFTIGLHACGALSNHIIYNNVKFSGRGLISFGCCYHKLNQKNDFPISHFYQEQFKLNLNLYSRTLASRAHKSLDFEDFKVKYFVKNYRQGLHLFLYHKLGIKDCFSVGEIHTREYKNPFEDYLEKKLNELNIKHNFTKNDFKAFYESEEIQYTLKKMFICNLIRWQIGRALEVYLLLDRVMYLKENNYEANLYSFFDETLSPRNLGILAFR